MDSNFGITQFLFQTFQEYERKKPFRFLLLKTLHNSENDHTRILLQLLRYKGVRSEYPFLASFIEKCVCRNCTDKKWVADFKKRICQDDPVVLFNDACIDTSIRPAHLQEGCPFIIIENKIKDAKDQYEQIQRYIETARKRTVNSSQIWVIYLTLNGNKKPADFSLTPLAMRYLNINDEQADIKTGYYPPIEPEKPVRFIELNYKEHIIPWIEQEVLPHVPYKDHDFLVTGILQYIYFLKENSYSFQEQLMCTKTLIEELTQLHLLLEKEQKIQMPAISSQIVKQSQKISSQCQAMGKYGKWLSELQDILLQKRENIVEIFRTYLETATKYYLGNLIGQDPATITVLKGTDGEIYYHAFALGKKNIHFEFLWNWDSLQNKEGFTFEFHDETGNAPATRNYLLNQTGEVDPHKFIQKSDRYKKDKRTLFSYPCRLVDLLDCTTESEAIHILERELNPIKQQILFLAKHTKEDVLKN